MDVQVFPHQFELALAAAKHFVSRTEEAVVQNGSATVALSGGSTPRTFYQVLANAGYSFVREVYWPMIHFFWSDERHVPPNHPASNYRLAYENLLSRVPVSKEKVHRVMSENPDAAAAAQAYEDTLIYVTKANLPRLDLILLGLGTDGHTASIFPGSEVLHETKRLVAAPWVEQVNARRITMTLPLINNASSVMFLVSGAEKAEIAREVLKGPKRYPAQEVRPTNGELVWLLDREAGSKI